MYLSIGSGTAKMRVYFLNPHFLFGLGVGRGVGLGVGFAGCCIVPSEDVCFDCSFSISFSSFSTSSISPEKVIFFVIVSFKYFTLLIVFFSSL